MLTHKKPVSIHNTGCSRTRTRSPHAALSLAALARTQIAPLSQCAMLVRSLSLAHSRATGASAVFCFYFEFTLRCVYVYECTCCCFVKPVVVAAVASVPLCPRRCCSLVRSSPPCSRCIRFCSRSQRVHNRAAES